MSDLFDREMQAALKADAEKLRAMGVDVDDPSFEDIPRAECVNWFCHRAVSVEGQPCDLCGMESD